YLAVCLARLHTFSKQALSLNRCDRLSLIELPIPKPTEAFHKYTQRLRSELEEELFSLFDDEATYAD
ncbi:hypothetical protein, partial [Natrialba swarupiae]|uniref:hypothetical protein n=1 Tax=Natrialba swarupiae TaxID=2448032 RepID=UPI001EE3E6E7